MTFVPIADLRNVRVVTRKGINLGPKGKIPGGVDVTDQVVGPDGKSLWGNLALLQKRGFVQLIATGGEVAPVYVPPAPTVKLPTVSELHAMTSRQLFNHIVALGMPEPNRYRTKKTDAIKTILEAGGAVPDPVSEGGEPLLLPPVVDDEDTDADDLDEEMAEGDGKDEVD
jgi:hypothetical protein